MSNLLDLHRIATDAAYVLALDELEQLVDAPACSSRARELSELIAEYEASVAEVVAEAVKSRAPFFVLPDDLLNKH